MTRRPARRGLISLASVFALLAVVVLLVVVCNAASLTTRRVAVQNAADAAAADAATEAARGMNQLTAAQHLIGQYLATAVLAHTPGGDELDRATGYRLDPAGQADLDAAYAAAVTAGALPDAALYRKARHSVSESGAAIGSARAQLRGLLAGLYRRRAGGATSAADAARLEAAVAAEWELLDRIEASARANLVPLRRLAEFTLVPALADHARRVVGQTPGRAEAAAADAARRWNSAGRLFPDTTGRGRRLELPVEPQTPDVVAAAGGWEVSQAVRAATPWVQYWRQPVLAFADRHLPLSAYADFYLDFSNRFTLEVARRQAEEFGTHLFVLRGGGAKGREAWARRDGSRRADELFGLFAIAHRPPPPLLGSAVFRQPQPDGTAAVAQAMLYNANPQDPDRPPGGLDPRDWQPVVGWDTLNWGPDVRVPEYRFGLRRDADGRVGQPSVVVNWRARRTPVTLLPEAAAAAGDDGPGRILRRAAAEWSGDTH